MLLDIIATFVAAGPLLAERTRQRKEDEHQHRIAEQKRYEEKQHRKREDNRWRRFVDIARGWREADLARGFLAALKNSEIESDQQIDGRSIEDWLNWAEERLQSADPMNHGAGAIFKSIASVNEWNYIERSRE